MKSKVRRAGLLLLTLWLTGCGGGDEGGSSGGDSPLPPPPTEQVQVVDGFSVAKPNKRTKLDLSAFVRGRGATLTSLTSEQPACGAGSFTGLTAEVNISDTTLCQYRFSARNSGRAEGVATLSVLATLAATPVLEPLSAVMTLSDTAKAFDVVALYGASLPAGYNLKADSVVVQGGTVQGAATQSGNIINYTQPGVADWNRVLFILEDPTKPGEDILGTLYITVSETANQAPTISNPKYNYSDAANAGADNPSIVTFQRVTLDLANLKNLTITDPENKDWQLIDVQSYSASVASAFPNDVTNKKFTFQAGIVGQHIVSYIVGDHEGGFRMGLMSITVGAKEQIKNWSNIDLVRSGLRFYAPPLFSELKSAISPEFIIEPTWDSAANGGTGNTIGAAGNLAATAYCSGKRLPKQADLDALRREFSLETELAQYPKARPYLISDASGTDFQTYNLTTGSVVTYVVGTTPNPYVMCVSDHGLSYVATPNTPYTGITNTVISNGTWQQIGTVKSVSGTTGDSPTLVGTPTNLGSGSLRAENFRLTPGGCAGDTCVLEAKAALNEYGSATTQITNRVMTSNSVNVPTTFLQNAHVTEARVTTNNSLANNVITLTLKDKDGNAVPRGTAVRLKYSFSTRPAFIPTITPGNNTITSVNERGEVEVNIRTDKIGTVTLINPSVMNGLPQVDTSTTVSFGTLFDPAPFIYPDTKRYNWVQANNYCNSMRPAARLPTIAELKTLFVGATSATVADGSQTNLELCYNHGWPLSGSLGADSCGGSTYFYWTSDAAGADSHYALSMTSGLLSPGYNDRADSAHVACIRPLLPFITPDEASAASTYNWHGANSYCNSMRPAARLPTRAELKTLFVNATSATVANGSQSNIEICVNYGWPLNRKCKGYSDFYWTSEAAGADTSYVVRMTNGSESSYHQSGGIANVACVR